MAVLLIKDVRVVDPASDLDAASDVLVANGCIHDVAENIQPGRAVRVLGRAGKPQSLSLIDGGGLWLCPGLVDVHVHLREPGFTEKETIRTGTAAAAAGGYTTVVCEPNTDPPTDSVAAVRWLAGRCRDEALVNVYVKAAMTVGRLGRKPVDVAALSEEEMVVALSDDGDPVVDLGVVEQVFYAAAEHAMLLSPHCEDSPAALERIAAGADPGFEPREDYTNETNYVERDLAVAARCGARVHFSHVSLPRTVETIARFSEGHTGEAAATLETTPHYLFLCRDDYADGDVPKVNPPLRSASDRDALLEALLAGRIDAIASDHAPHTATDKAGGASGLIGLETTLGLVLTHLVHTGKVEPADAAFLLSTNPARIYGLPGGTLAAGAAADMVLIDPDMEWTVAPEQLHSKSANTPFAGWDLRGKAVATYCGGEEVYADDTFERRRMSQSVT